MSHITKSIEEGEEEFADSGTINTKNERLLHNACNDLLFAIEPVEIKKARDEMFSLVRSVLAAHTVAVLEGVRDEVEGINGTSIAPCCENCSARMYMRGVLAIIEKKLTP